MLRLEHVSAAYGRIRALTDLSLEVPDGKIVALLGANGAGKSSTLKVVTGLLRPTAGAVTFDGHDLTRRPAEAIVPLGISMAPEGRQVFTQLTVAENLRMGAYSRRDAAGVRRDLEWVLSLFPRLRERYGQEAGTLSGGEQQMLAIGRALMARPRLLLLDEPSLGLAPLVVREIFATIRQVNAEGMSVLLVEQNANLALQVAHHAYILETGRLVLSGPAGELRQNPDVKRAYLGG
ncbi:branched-chain amino acid transport system ATP-binding protein [Symbiobacterium terraclitae]|uniref:Branched-chain amino acid transport system ATP-binding protein n=1 Tax=Symbiobacterium terraclitae TaxID=557451 RepID=A0ABS4JSC2_9FIRM|nr:ABC transporter ATP-binding protein [Symbiobacterium terraclitae]MBP2017806.1 branched-chain amino acid transport system ATP-binding protein [Symbiobacterium terraclitae]